MPNVCARFDDKVRELTPIHEISDDRRPYSIFGHRFITTNYVLTELVALLISPLRVPRPQIIAFVDGLKASPHVDIVHIDSILDAQAWQLFADRLDKDWSLVDCASFVVMRQRGITEVLTTDSHFEQAGFVCLLRA